MDQPDNEEQQSGNAPPYLSATTFLNFIESHRRTLPTRIDRSIMSNLSGGDQVRILRALQYFDLIDDDQHPTAAFHHLTELDEGAMSAAWAALLRQAYPFVFQGFNLEKATQGQLEERFRDQGIKGETVRKAVAFFIGMARNAEIALSPYFKGVGKRPTPTARVQRRTSRRATSPKEDTGSRSVSQNGASVPAGKLPAVIQAWIDEMPPAGQEWSREDFDSWLNLFAGSIERLYKIPQKK